MPSEKKIEAVAKELFQYKVETFVCDGTWEENAAIHSIFIEQATRALTAAEQAEPAGEAEPVAYTTQAHLDKVACGKYGRMWQEPMPFHPDIALYTTPPASAIREAVQAVIDRWDTPHWKNVESTAVFIGRLRDALAQGRKE